MKAAQLLSFARTNCSTHFDLAFCRQTIKNKHHKTIIQTPSSKMICAENYNSSFQVVPSSCATNGTVDPSFQVVPTIFFGAMTDGTVNPSFRVVPYSSGLTNGTVDPSCQVVPHSSGLTNGAVGPSCQEVVPFSSSSFQVVVFPSPGAARGRKRNLDENDNSASNKRRKTKSGKKRVFSQLTGEYVNLIPKRRRPRMTR